MRGRSFPECNQWGYVPYRDIQAYLDARLRELLDGTATDIFQEGQASAGTPQEHVDAAEVELTELEERIGRLIDEQSAAPEAAQNFYRKHVGDLTDQSEKLRKRVLQLKRNAAATTQQHVVAQNTTIAELRKVTREGFWLQPDTTINQMLHRLFGNRQLVILDKQIVGSVERRRKRIHRHDDMIAMK